MRHIIDIRKLKWQKHFSKITEVVEFKCIPWVNVEIFLKYTNSKLKNIFQGCFVLLI